MKAIHAAIVLGLLEQDFTVYSDWWKLNTKCDGETEIALCRPVRAQL